MEATVDLTKAIMDRMEDIVNVADAIHHHVQHIEQQKYSIKFDYNISSLSSTRDP